MLTSMFFGSRSSKNLRINAVESLHDLESEGHGLDMEWLHEHVQGQ